MTESRLPDYLDHMRQAAMDACVYVDGLTKSDFIADKRTQQAVIRGSGDSALNCECASFLNFRGQSVECTVTRTHR